MYQSEACDIDQANQKIAFTHSSQWRNFTCVITVECSSIMGTLLWRVRGSIYGERLTLQLMLSPPFSANEDVLSEYIVARNIMVKVPLVMI